jgi:RNA polymerase sigma-70 factor (ECF subfamily)
LFRSLRALGVRDADLPDVVHDVFVTVYRRFDDVALYSSTRAWVHGIAVRVAANYRRHTRQTRERLCAEVPENAAVRAEPGNAIDLLRVLAALDEDQREVFVLYELEELSMPEVAEALGCPASTAYSRLYSARRAIRTYYGNAAVAGGNHGA